MNDSSIPWHLKPGHKEIQINKVMSSVHCLLNGEAKKLNTDTQGFAEDEQAAREFVQIIDSELSKLGLEGQHDLHQSKNGSGNWYYSLRGFWPKGTQNVFNNFQEACSYARSCGGKIMRCGDKWKVTQ